MAYFDQFAHGKTETKETQIRRAYCAIRRKDVARARVQVTVWPESPKEIFSNDHAKDALRQARLQVQNDTALKYGAPSIWKGLGGSDGKLFSAYGETACRWIENPESKGLRFVGLAHDVAKSNYSYLRNAVEHTGWFLDNEILHETVSGVVYQLPARDGKPRYVVGYADPYNCDKDGNGPALLSVEVLEGERHDSYNHGYNPALRDAARRADSIAESMAEQEREYQDARRAGQTAREKTQEATQAGQEWIAEIRAFRDLWKARRNLQTATLKKQVKTVRAACANYIETRDTARVMRNDKPSTRQPETLQGAWLEGYENAY